MFIDHPLYKKAYLHHEIEQICIAFCTQMKFDQPIIQVTFKPNKIVLTIKLGSSSETTALKLNEYDLFQIMQESLKEKKLWDEKNELVLITKLK